MHPATFPGDALQRCQSALLRTTKTGDSGNQLDRQRQRANREVIQTNRNLSIVIRRIKSDYLTMPVDRVRAVLQRGKVSTLHSLLKRSLQPFNRPEEI